MPVSGRPWPGAQTAPLPVIPARAGLQPGRVGETFTGGHPTRETSWPCGAARLIACRDAPGEVSIKLAGGKPMSAEAFNGYCRAANKEAAAALLSPL